MKIKKKQTNKLTTITTKLKKKHIRNVMVDKSKGGRCQIHR